MLLLLLLLCVQTVAAVGLQDAALAACGCESCYLEEAVLGANYSVVSYGNASTDEFEWAGLVRDFVPQPLLLNSFVYDLNCSSSIAVLLNGSTVLDEEVFVSSNKTQCVANFAPQLDPGDFSVVVFLKSLGPPGTRLVSLQTQATGTPNAMLQSLQPLTLVLNTSLAACALPSEFDFCGTTFFENCPAEPGVYTGVCATSNYTLPVGCGGDVLFAAPPLPPPRTFLSTAQGAAVVAVTATASLAMGVTSSVTTGAMSTGSVIIYAARQPIAPRRWIV